MKLLGGNWLGKKLADAPEPDGCICGIIAGCCDRYPNCYGNPDWKPDKIAPAIEISPDGHDKESNQT